MNRFTPRHTLFLVFGLAFVFALLFAFYTDHVWEDYYITYRSSKNLATGHGLVFNPGDRLHTFTSPLGVLLPAAANLLTGNTSDTAALWVFRMMCLCALGSGTALLFGLTRRFEYPLIASSFLALFIVTDAKVVDFTINGMETAFMLLFLAYALRSHFTPGRRQWLHLGIAWAGLMWTRPDSFIYLGLIAAGTWLFNDPDRTGSDRRQLIWLYLRAGLLSTALYGPWLIWATWYYGTAVPHTIVAKGAQSGGLGAAGRLLHGFWQMPWLMWQGKAPAEGAFLPSYYMFPAWPAWMLPFGRALATVSSLLWLVPRMRVEVKAASFAFFGGAAYLSFVPYFPFPWYFPSTFLLAALALAGLGGQLWATGRIVQRGLAGTMGVATLVGALLLTFGTARQARAQQAYIETGLRRVIGEWLREQSRPGDTVFMEPLGYIGYFSGLKTYDWPGMSSREMTEAKLIVGTQWGDLIRYLQPTWLVLRPNGEGDLPTLAPVLHFNNYEFVRDFDRLAEVQQLDIPGKKLLEFDGRFRVYRLKQPTRHDVDGAKIASPFPSSLRSIGGKTMRLVHAPGSMVVDVPAGMNTVSGLYGFPPDAYEGDGGTDGAVFRIFWTDGSQRIELSKRHLNPVNSPDDRGLQSYQLNLPHPHPKARVRLIFETEPAGSTVKDWTCWSQPTFRP